METKDIILLVIGAFIGIVGGYFVHYTANPLSGRFQKWRSDRAQKKAKESIEKAKIRKELLTKKLKDTTLFVTTPSAYMSYLTLTLLRSFLYIGVSLLLFRFTEARLPDIFVPTVAIESWTELLVLAIGAVISILVCFIVLYGLGFLFELIDNASFVLRFEASKETTLQQIAELQEVIDRENPQSEGGY